MAERPTDISQLSEEDLLAFAEQQALDASYLSLDRESVEEQMRPLIRQLAPLQNQRDEIDRQLRKIADGYTAINARLEEFERQKRRAELGQYLGGYLAQDAEMLISATGPVTQGLGHTLQRIASDATAMEAMPDLVEQAGIELYGSKHNGERMAVETPDDSLRLAFMTYSSVNRNLHYAVGYHPKPGTVERVAIDSFIATPTTRQRYVGSVINRHFIGLDIDLDRQGKLVSTTPIALASPVASRRGNIETLIFLPDQIRALAPIINTMGRILEEGIFVLPKALRSQIPTA